MWWQPLLEEENDEIMFRTVAVSLGWELVVVLWLSCTITAFVCNKTSVAKKQLPQCHKGKKRHRAFETVESCSCVGGR